MSVNYTIKTRIGDIINEYHKANDQLTESIIKANTKCKNALSEKIYTPQHSADILEKEYEAAESIFKSQAESLNERLNAALTLLRKNVVPALSKAEKTPDYSIKVNNALQFLQIEGANITDEAAAHILGDFLKDVEAMQQFRRVIGHQLEGKASITNSYGKTTFPLTFGYLERCEQVIAALEDMEETAKKMFLRNKTASKVDHIGGVRLWEPMDSYTQLVSEYNIVEQAGTFEEMCTEHFNSDN